MTQVRKPTPLNEIPLGELEYYPSPGDYFAEALVENGCEIMFGVQGGDTWFLTDCASRRGIKIITFHHEQGGMYAAEAYGRITGKAGWSYYDCGPGTHNMASALRQAYITCAPVVFISGSTTAGEEGLPSMQFSDAVRSYSHQCKWVVKASIPHAIKRLVTQATKDAQAYPKGPCGIEFPLFTFNSRIPAPEFDALFTKAEPHRCYIPQWQGEETGKEFPPPGGNPEAVEKAVKHIMAAEKPLIIYGDGVHYSRSSAELKEFMELAQVPGGGRHLGRGAVEDNHPLAVRAGRFAPEANPLIILGHRVTWHENFGLNWPGPCIQINESAEHIVTTLKTETVIIGSPKVVLRQMIDVIKRDNLKPPPQRAKWVERTRADNRKASSELLARTEKYNNHKPVHHAVLSREMAAVINDFYGGMNRIMLDGFTLSNFAPPFFTCHRSSQILDAGLHAGVGHSFGWSVGAFFADPEETKRAPTLCLVGDAGFGLGGMDIETALRYDVPVVYVVTNNNGWMSAIEYFNYGKNWRALGPQDQPYGEAFLPGLRYYKISEVFPGIHSEHVTEPSQIRPALERAFRAAEKKGYHGKGGPAVVQVDVDLTLITPGVRLDGGASSGGIQGHIPYRDLPPYGQRARRYGEQELEKQLGVKMFDFDKWGIPPVDPNEPGYEIDPWRPLGIDEECI